MAADSRHSKTRHTVQRCLRTAFFLLWIPGQMVIAAPARIQPVVIGQSLPLGGADDGTAARIVAGAQAYVAAVNAQGGIRGRPLRLITLKDDATPAQHARNLRRLVKDYKAVALLNCVGEASCTAAAAVATELQVPLVGPIARAKRLTRRPSSQVFRVRAPFEREAEALARQLRAMGVSMVVLLTESSPSSEPVRAQQAAMLRQGLKLSVMPIDSVSNPRAVADALTQLGRMPYQAAVLDLSVDTLDSIARQGLEQRKEWPLVLTSTSSGTLNALLSVFSSHIIGFTSVVPNPEVASLPLTAELQRNADRMPSGAWAITYAGLEAYINTKICVEAIRRAAPRTEPERITTALAGMAGYDLGGFSVSFSSGRVSGSDLVDIGVRSRNGMLLK